MAVACTTAARSIFVDDPLVLTSKMTTGQALQSSWKSGLVGCSGVPAQCLSYEPSSVDGSGSVAETVSNSGVTIKIVGTAVMGSVSAMVNRKARPAELLSPEEAAAKMQEAAEPSTTRQDIREQVLGDVFAARAAAAPPVPPALQQALQAQAAAQHAAAQPQMQGQAVPVVQGVPVSGAKA
ncbi:unnamed protein product [Symbiodinium sp. CCMP2592]|nr:unnamed protein product [Symbiodinium sp. CCMP2592]